MEWPRIRRAHPWVLKRWIPWVVWVLTTLGALAVALMLHNQEDARHRAHFAIAATERIHVLEVTGPAYFRPVRHLAAAFRQQQGGLDEADFLLLVRSIPLAGRPALMALQWIPMVPAREEYLVRFSYPENGDPGAGLADETSLHYLQLAGQQQHLFITPWYRANGQVLFRAIRPVFGKGAAGRELLGFVSGVYQVERLISDSLCVSAAPNVRILVSDPRSGQDAVFRCVGEKAEEARAKAAPAPTLSVSRSARIDETAAPDGLGWTVTVAAEPGAYAASPWIPVVIGAGGLILGAILALFHRTLLRQEAQVRHLVQERTEELAHRTEQLEAMNSELEQFAYVASHDLRAPLRAVSQLASWIQEEAADHLDPENRKRLQLMIERVARMDRLIADLLAYSRAGHPTGGTREPVALRRLLGELTGELPLPDGFRVLIEPNLPTLVADPLHLRQIFQNLITNAASHHDHAGSGTVRVGAEEDGRCWRLEVADDGPGVPAEERDEIFRMFTSLGKQTDPQHTGIGLAIVRKLVRSYGGRIDVIDNAPRGARFRIWWPRT